MNRINQEVKEPLNEDLIPIARILNEADLASIKDNIANLDDGIGSLFDSGSKNGGFGASGGIAGGGGASRTTGGGSPSGEVVAKKKLGELKKRKKVRKGKRVLQPVLPHKLTLAQIIDDKVSGKPTSSEVSF